MSGCVFVVLAPQAEFTLHSVPAPAPSSGTRWCVRAFFGAVHSHYVAYLTATKSVFLVWDGQTSVGVCDSEPTAICCDSFLFDLGALAILASLSACESDMSVWVERVIS